MGMKWGLGLKMRWQDNISLFLRIPGFLFIVELAGLGVETFLAVLLLQGNNEGIKFLEFYILPIRSLKPFLQISLNGAQSQYCVQIDAFFSILLSELQQLLAHLDRSLRHRFQWIQIKIIQNHYFHSLITSAAPFPHSLCFPTAPLPHYFVGGLFERICLLIF